MTKLTITFSTERLTRYYAGLYLLICSLIIAITCYVLTVSHWPGPFRDMWENFSIVVMATEGNWGWSELWEPYGGAHRLVLARLAIMADYRWFDGSGYLVRTLSFCSLAILAGLFYHALHTSHLCLLEKLVGFITVLTCLFSATLLYCYLNIFDIQSFFSVMFVSCSTWLLIYSRPSQCLTIGLSMAAASLAAMSHMSGLVIWPVNLLLVLRGSYSGPQRIAYGLAMVVCYSAYFYQLPMNGTDVIDTSFFFSHSLIDLGMALLIYPLLYLASPLSQQFHWAGVLLSGLACLLLGRLLLRFLFRPAFLSPLQTFCLSLGLFAGGVAIVTVLGRIYDFNNIFALRYQNYVLIFWIAILTLILDLQTGKLFRSLLVHSLLFIFVLGLQQLPYWNFSIKLGNSVHLANLGIIVGLADDPVAIRASVSRHHFMAERLDYSLETEVDFLQEHQLGVFADNSFQEVRNTIIPANPEDCTFQFFSLNEKALSKGRAMLALTLTRPVSVQSTIVAFQDQKPNGLLQPRFADDLSGRLLNSLSGTNQFHGFRTANFDQLLFINQHGESCLLSERSS